MRIGASFRVHGLKSSEVTEVLGVVPTKPGDGSRPWSLTVDAEDDADLDVVLTTLLDDVEHGASALRDRGASLDFFCFVESSALERAVVLSPGLLARIGATGAELWLDVYGDD